MRTRGKTKVEIVPADFAKDANDSRDMAEEVAEGNGYPEEKMDEVSLYCSTKFLTIMNRLFKVELTIGKV